MLDQPFFLLTLPVIRNSAIPVLENIMKIPSYKSLVLQLAR